MTVQVRYTSVNGVRTRYYEAGEGAPVLLIHGVGSSADTWIKTLQALSQHNRVIAPDLVGHGFTAQVDYAGPPQPHMLKHLLALVDHLGIDRFSICGSSYGAMLALLCYFEVKERIDRIVLLSSATATLSDEERLGSMQKAYDSSVNAYRGPTLDTVTGRMKNLFHSADRIPTELVLLQLNIFSQPGMLQNFEKLMKGLMDLPAVRPYRVDNRYPEVEVPMLMLWGLNDKQVNVERARACGAQSKDAYFIGIDQCGHIPHLEQAEQVNGYIVSFLRGEPMAQHRLSA